MRINPHDVARRNLDEARDAFIKAAFHLTTPNRLNDGVAEAMLYGALGMLKLAAGDLGERARERAEEVIRMLQKKAA
jgi:hypothetical protein